MVDPFIVPLKWGAHGVHPPGAEVSAAGGAPAFTATEWDDADRFGGASDMADIPIAKVIQEVECRYCKRSTTSPKTIVSTTGPRALQGPE